MGGGLLLSTTVVLEVLAPTFQISTCLIRVESVQRHSTLGSLIKSAEGNASDGFEGSASAALRPASSTKASRA
jgi:hypothetical protein